MIDRDVLLPVYGKQTGVTALDHHTNTFLLFLDSPDAECITFWSNTPLGAVLDVMHFGPCALVAKQENRSMNVITRIYVELKPLTENKPCA